MSTSLLGLAEPCNLLIYWLSIIYVGAGKTGSWVYFSLFLFYFNSFPCSVFFLLSVVLFHLTFVLTWMIFEETKI